MVYAIALPSIPCIVLWRSHTHRGGGGAAKQPQTIEYKKILLTNVNITNKET